VDFTATWCGPCKAIAPLYEQAAASSPHIIFLKVDVDEAQDVARECGVSAMPTFQLYRSGAKAAEFCGADPAKLKEMIASA
jgi:thioredoxin 1